MAFDLEQELASLEEQHLRRRLQVVEECLPGGKVRVGGRELLNLSSNDYLGLAGDSRLIKASQEAAARWGAGSTASRLIVGTLALHQEVEEEVARFKGTERAVLFNTGYMANVGVIAALTGKGDVILSDKLNHASIIDGMRLSEAAFYRYPHRDLDRLETLIKKHAGARRLLIVTDSVFSVDGDLAPLRELVALKERYGGWLMLDEAHATGNFRGQRRGFGGGLRFDRPNRGSHGHLFEGPGKFRGLYRGKGSFNRTAAQPGQIVYLFHGAAAGGPGGHAGGGAHCPAGADQENVCAGTSGTISCEITGGRFRYSGQRNPDNPGAGGRQSEIPGICGQTAPGRTFGSGHQTAHRATRGGQTAGVALGRAGRRRPGKGG